MKTASPVPSRPPTAFVTGRRRISRSAVITSWIPTATAAAVFSPASALTVTNATGPDAGVHDRAAVAEHLQRARRELRPALSVGLGVGAH